MEHELLLRMIGDMILARRFEERAAQAYSEGAFRGFLHLYPGEEAVAVGVLHAAEPSDYVVSTYRDHVHALVRGVPARQVMAELYGRRDGICRGMGGSMHLFDRSRRFMGGYAIVGETFPIAIGVAYGIRLRNLSEAVVCFFGDGAANQGTFHESLNMAALWQLPVLFVCENNRYQIGTEIHRHSAEIEIHKRARAYRMPAAKADGMDLFAVHRSAEQMLAQVRAGSGPQLLELETYRFRGHSMADAGDYRPKAEVDAEKATGPLKRIRDELAKPDAFAAFRLDEQPIADMVDEETFRWLEEEARKTVDDAVEFAENSPDPALDDAWNAMYAGRRHEPLIREEDSHG
jgi:pyruvate dehydrogenase E1 component alpha subunit